MAARHKRANRRIGAGDVGPGARGVSSIEELDYSDLLEVYGLQFVAGLKPGGNWKLERRPDQTAEQKKNLELRLGPSPRK